MRVHTASSYGSPVWRPGEVTWEELLSWARDPAPVKECGGYVLGRFSGTRRRTAELVARDALTLDADYNAAELPEKVAELGVRSLVHSTYSSAPDNPRWRVIIPLARPVTADEYATLAEWVAVLIGTTMFDRTSFRPAQFMWRPSAEHRQWYSHHVTDGPDLDPDAMLASVDPQALGASRTGPRRKPRRDPLGVEGVVGAFNRAYQDLEELVRAYELPYVAAHEGRWRYEPATSIAGMGPIEGTEGLYFSHHATDPATGQACTAFDLVRLHRFAELDEGVKPGTPVHKLKSHDAMCELASQDYRVRAELSGLPGVDFEDVAPEDAWMLGLARTKTGAVSVTPDNLDILREHDPVLSRLWWDSLAGAMTIGVDRLPWDRTDREDEFLTGADYVYLGEYLERVYKIKLSRPRVEEVAQTAAHLRRVNPLTEHLRSLVWDGVPRLEECLPVSEHTEYTRLVARKALCGAVARALEPGCTMDHALILHGSEGLGKTRWMRAMSLGRWAELKKLEGKDTYLAMSQAWIMIADELDAMRKAALEQLKEFLTRTADTYRIPWDREARPHRRRVAVWGSTNDPKFLARQEGNRRFLVVTCDRVDEDKLEAAYIDQVWAEAIHLLEHGETLWLTPDEYALVASERARYTAEEPLIGEISEYLDMAVPERWDAMPGEERALWFHSTRWMPRDEGEPMRVQERTCSLAIWREVMRGLGPLREADMRRIGDALRAQPGWEPVGEAQIPLYGVQEIYVRTGGLL